MVTTLPGAVPRHKEKTEGRGKQEEREEPTAEAEMLNQTEQMSAWQKTTETLQTEEHGYLFHDIYSDSLQNHG